MPVNNLEGRKILFVYGGNEDLAWDMFLKMLPN
jgi:hypothetical protein